MINEQLTHKLDGNLMPGVTPSFWVRDVPIFGDAVLAPMDGYSDWPFRSVCRSLGSAMSYSE
jgi:tRNA-dihydrouridine synthase B